jgi:hypothetical protein
LLLQYEAYSGGSTPFCPIFHGADKKIFDLQFA